MCCDATCSAWRISHCGVPRFIYVHRWAETTGASTARVQCGKYRRQRFSMESLLSEYFPILVFLAIAGGISIAMVTASVVLARQRPDKEKLSPYECGFDPFEDARIRFDVRYYLVAILFIIFDLEVAFLFPWAVSLGDIGIFGFWSMVVFLAVLTVGFIYEWKKGALEWE
jgi:NADH-quinone oxidoreductase subunit A